VSEGDPAGIRDRGARRCWEGRLRIPFHETLSVPGSLDKGLIPGWLRPNSVAEYQLQEGDSRVLYDVLGEEELISAAARKMGSILIVAGEESRENQDDLPEPLGDGFAGNAE
jgi:hypothetical protein